MDESKEKPDNPWQTVSTRLVYDNPWIRVREDQVIRPDGKPGIYGVVHYKNIAIGIVAVDDEGHIQLVGQHRYPMNQYSWEIPEGGCSEGEDPLHAAQRELLEETGLQARNWKLVGEADLSNSVSDEKALWYLATGLIQGDAQPDGTEVLQHRRVRLSEALRMVDAHEITDALSIISLLAYARQKESALSHGLNRVDAKNAAGRSEHGEDSDQEDKSLGSRKNPG
jgi:8-oxo-dGTP pyrophosphatase MutT (NUDIX family)